MTPGISPLKPTGRLKTILIKTTHTTLGAAAGALALAVGSVQAEPAYDPATGAPAVHVRVSDLNLATPAGVKLLYRRILAAAQEVCPQADPWQIGLYRATTACQKLAIERAVRDVHDPHLAALVERRDKG